MTFFIFKNAFWAYVPDYSKGVVQRLYGSWYIQLYLQYIFPKAKDLELHTPVSPVEIVTFDR